MRKFAFGLLVGILFISCTAEKKRPNFLFVLVDDQSPFELAAYDSTSILHTPTLDRLAASGMVIDRAYHMGSFHGAVCTPSRTMIMSGRSLWHLPSKNGKFATQGATEDLPNYTMGAVFNRAGYSTMRTCKSSNSYQAANDQFTINKSQTSRQGNEQEGSAWHAQQVLDYLSKRKSEETTDPFLIYLGFSHPHDPRNGTPELLEKYGAVNHTDTSTLPSVNHLQPALPHNYLSVHPFHHGHINLRDELRVSGVWDRRDTATVRNELGREYACVENIDFELGKVLDRLEEMGELDNTYVIYTSDHGIAIGRHGLMGKQNLYEHTWRVPFIVSGPGIKAGTRMDGNIYLGDVLPTLCDLAGIEKPSTINTESFVSVLKGESNTIRETLYGVYCGGTKPGIRSVRIGDWKLIKYDVLDGAVRETQLFNLADNPLEFLPEHGKNEPMKTNLATDPKYSDKLKEMEKLLAREMEKYKDPYKLWDQ